RVERFAAAGIERAHGGVASHQLHRGSFLRARLGEEQRAVREVERGEQHLGTHTRLSAWLAPAQPPRDHQVQDQEQIAIEFEDDPLPDPPDAADQLATNRLEWRIDRSQDEGTEEIDARETMPDDMAGQRLEIDDNVGKFRQLLLQPLDDLLTRPVMMVVQVKDDRIERQTLVAALGTAAADVFEAVEQ